MAVLLQIREAKKSYGDQMLLDSAEASMIDDVKVGFVGRNGAGKSTLLRVLLGEEELDSGEIIRHPSLQIGYLRQHDPFNEGESALDFMMRDSGQPDWRCGEIAAQFELKGAYLNGPIQQLSGGWQTRVKLAALLLHDPNLLLLDEPTNFLDLRTQILLEHFLKDFRKACLIVSHDRHFLRSTCDETLELSRGKLTMFPGKINKYLEYVDERKEHDERVNATVLAKQKQLQRFIDKNRANASTASQARSKARQLERLETIEVTGDEATANVRAPVLTEIRQGAAVRCTNLSIGYDDHTVADEITLEIEHGSRAAIVGDNGQGKTTLLRTLVSSLKPVSGEIRWGFGCNIGVYAQHVYTSLPQDMTVMDYMEYHAKRGTTMQQILKQLGSMLFSGKHTKKKIKVLSGGERARVCMASMLMGDYNVLVLDEPGNHLDVETVDSLANALLDYKGTVLLTSHDRHFMSRVATSIIEVRAGKVTTFGESYEAYVYSVNKQVEEGERERTGKTVIPGGKAPTAGKPKQKDERAMRKALQKLERKIAKLDDEKKALNTEMLNTADAAKALELHNKIEPIAKELTEAEERWCELSEEIGDW